MGYRFSVVYRFVATRPSCRPWMQTARQSIPLTVTTVLHSRLLADERRAVTQSWYRAAVGASCVWAVKSEAVGPVKLGTFLGSWQQRRVALCHDSFSAQRGWRGIDGGPTSLQWQYKLL